MRKNKRIIGIATVIVLLTSTQLTVADPATLDLRVHHPPELQIHVDVVAIALAESSLCAQPLSTYLEHAFVRAGITVVDRMKLDKVLRDHKLRIDDAVNEKAAKVGQLSGARVLILLEVSHCGSAKGHRESVRDKNTGKLSYNYITQKRVSGTVRVMDLANGHVFASRPFETQTQLKNAEGSRDADATMDEAGKSAAESVQKLLLPWEETVSMPFNSDEECNLNTAYGLVKERDFDVARERSRINVARCESTGAKPSVIAKAHYNLGVLQMHFGEYDAARASFAASERAQSNKNTTKALALVASNSVSASSHTAAPGSSPTAVPPNTFPLIDRGIRKRELRDPKEQVLDE